MSIIWKIVIDIRYSFEMINKSFTGLRSVRRLMAKCETELSQFGCIEVEIRIKKGFILPEPSTPSCL